jgi:hypothetical protein
MSLSFVGISSFGLIDLFYWFSIHYFFSTLIFIVPSFCRCGFSLCFLFSNCLKCKSRSLVWGLLHFGSGVSSKSICAKGFSHQPLVILASGGHFERWDIVKGNCIIGTISLKEIPGSPSIPLSLCLPAIICWVAFSAMNTATVYYANSGPSQ